MFEGFECFSTKSRVVIRRSIQRSAAQTTVSTVGEVRGGFTDLAQAVVDDGDEAESVADEDGAEALLDAVQQSADGRLD